jgi:hypothetical protein
MEKKREIKLIKYIPIRYADPITSLDLNDEYLCFGSMLGLVEFYIINSNTLQKISDTQDEFISGIKLRNSVLYLCIGDLQINKYNLEEDINNPETVRNYQSEEMHKEFCNKCLTIFNNNFLIRNIITFPDKPSDKPIKKDVKFFMKNIYHESIDDDYNDKYELSNYCVPFDFDGKYYIIIDFIEKNDRIFYIYDVTTKEMKHINLDKDLKEIGHISHLKILQNENIFIVRNYNICEIRKFDFELVKKLNINCNEILAYDILFDQEEFFDDISNEINDKEIKYIVILDIDTNIILYDYKNDKAEILLNLENDDIGIDNDIKDQKFFLFEYPYYIKISKKHIAISSDYGCVLLSYN